MVGFVLWGNVCIWCDSLCCIAMCFCVSPFFLIQLSCMETQRRHVMCWDSASPAKRINFRHCQLSGARELFGKRPNPISSSAHHYFGIRIFNILLISAYGILIHCVTVCHCRWFVLWSAAALHLTMLLSRLIRCWWSWSPQDNRTHWLTYEDIGLGTELSKSVRWCVDWGSSVLSVASGKPSPLHFIILRF